MDWGRSFMARMVQCAKLNKELPGLARLPFRGELGWRVYHGISQIAWEMWKRQSTLLINHYHLNLSDPETQRFLRAQMELYLFQDQTHIPVGWTPDSSSSARGLATSTPPILPRH